MDAGVDPNCAFPPEVEPIPVDTAVVAMVVDVRADGTPSSVTILSDPGWGFAEAARKCAMTKTYVAALDESGHPVASRTSPFKLRFWRAPLPAH
jgi:protein TonB